MDGISRGKPSRWGRCGRDVIPNEGPEDVEEETAQRIATRIHDDRKPPVDGRRTPSPSPRVTEMMRAIRARDMLTSCCPERPQLLTFNHMTEAS
jgi:hypothetical protein